ncbi:MAG TPA: YceI family protein [Chloroflexota bacterium]|nr:YceI family protein [Chloroflexota bacterium]HUM69957.1 YceI family protein [Chloroflexota bacterium]
MKLRRFLLGGGLLVVTAVFLSACGLLQEPEAASAPIEAVPLVIETPTAAAASDTAIADTGTTATGPVIFQIDPAQSQVRFELDEDLRGSRITVVGTTNQVAGELAVDLSNPTATQVGIIQINARTLATDNNFRNRAIQNEILDTGAYEFITFTPTAVTGLPESVNVDDPVTFTIAGNLTIRDVTNAVTFTVQATAVSATQLTGTATATVSRGDYGLQIPSVPNVANVEEEVELIIDFVANAS